MSRSARVRLDFGPGEQVFRLTYPMLQELQEARECGPLFLMKRIGNGEWRVEDLVEVHRLGLIGGGMAAPKALAMVRRYITERDDPAYLETAQNAFAILAAALTGIEEDPAGKPSGEAEPTPNPSPTDDGDLPPSGEPQPS